MFGFCSVSAKRPSGDPRSGRMWPSSHSSSRPFSLPMPDGRNPGNPNPLIFRFMEEDVKIYFPSTKESIAQFLNSTRENQDPDMYRQLVATLAYTAENAKFATGHERQEWIDLFIDTFKIVSSEIVGDPETVLGLC